MLRSDRFQWELLTFLMFVVPPSGSIRSNSVNSTVWPFACNFSARFFVASSRARCELGMPQRAMTISRPSAPLRTIGAG